MDTEHSVAEAGKGRDERELNYPKESGFARQYLPLNWHQAFLSGSMETQGSVPEVN